MLVAPQIGDTMDPDSQVTGGVFATLSVPKIEQDRIKAGFASYETVRNGIEAASATRHFELFALAVLGSRDSFTGKPLAEIWAERRGDAPVLLLFTFWLCGLGLARPIHPDRLTQETGS